MIKILSIFMRNSHKVRLALDMLIDLTDEYGPTSSNVAGDICRVLKKVSRNINRHEISNAGGWRFEDIGEDSSELNPLRRLPVEERLKLPVAATKLDTEIVLMLYDIEIYTLKDLVQHTESDLLKYRGIGKKSHKSN